MTLKLAWWILAVLIGSTTAGAWWASAIEQRVTSLEQERDRRFFQDTPPEVGR